MHSDAEGVGTVSEHAALSRDDIAAGMERARVEFHQLRHGASRTELRRVSEGTRWNNEQLMFHMLFGYLIVRALLVLVNVFGRLPEGASRRFAGLLNAVNSPFHVINYWGSRVGARLFGSARMGRKMDQVIAYLQRHLRAETDTALAHSMHFPTRWDPFFADVMTLAEIYHYATQHFDFHRRQLTLDHVGPESHD